MPGTLRLLRLRNWLDHRFLGPMVVGSIPAGVGVPWHANQTSCSDGRGGPFQARTTVDSEIVRNQSEQFSGTHSALLGDGVEGTIWPRVNATLLQKRHYLLDRHFKFSA